MSTIVINLLLAQIPAPMLEAEPASVDRGEVRSGVLLSQSFTLHHRGKQPIAITDLSAGCGCLRPRISTKRILPGESAKLAFEVNTLSQAIGPNQWKATIRYQPETAEGVPPAPVESLEVMIQATIVREIDIDAVAVVLTGEGELTHTLTITDRRAKPMVVEKARCDLKEIQIQPYRPTTDAQGRSVQRVRITVPANYPPGHYTDVVALLSNDPLYEELRVPIQISRRRPGELIASPDHLNLRFAVGQATASGLVRLREPNEKPVLVEKIEADHPAIQNKWATGPASVATIRITVDPGKQPMSGQGRVKIYLVGSPENPITLPVSWTVP